MAMVTEASLATEVAQKHGDCDRMRIYSDASTAASTVADSVSNEALEEDFAVADDCKTQRAHEWVRSRIISRVAYEKSKEMRPVVRSVSQRSARPHGACRAAARTRLVSRAIESASDMPTIISGGRRPSHSAGFQAKLCVSPVLNTGNPLREALQDVVDAGGAVDVNEWLGRQQEKRELEAFQFLADEEVALAEKGEALKMNTSSCATNDVVAEDGASFVFECEDAKTRRAAARRETCRRKSLQYTKSLEKKSLRNLPCSSLQHMSQPHGAGRAATRTRLSHGTVEAAADMPAIVQTGCGRKRKSRVSPMLKPSVSPVFTDQDTHKVLLGLPTQALLEEQQQQRLLEASLALASHVAEVELDREFAEVKVQPHAQLESENTQQLPSLLPSAMNLEVDIVANKTWGDQDANSFHVQGSEQMHAQEQQQQLQHELQELQQLEMQELEFQELHVQQQLELGEQQKQQQQQLQEQQQQRQQQQGQQEEKNTDQEEYPQFLLLQGESHAANEAISSMANEQEQLLVAAQAAKINAEVEAEKIKEAAVRDQARIMVHARADAAALKQAALVEAEAEIRAMRAKAERELQASKVQAQAQGLALHIERQRRNSEELQDRFIARAAALLATKEEVAATLWDEDWELVPVSTGSVCFGNTQLFNIADPEECE
jgi:hypothetical protein